MPVSDLRSGRCATARRVVDDLDHHLVAAVGAFGSRVTHKDRRVQYVAVRPHEPALELTAELADVPALPALNDLDDAALVHHPAVALAALPHPRSHQIAGDRVARLVRRDGRIAVRIGRVGNDEAEAARAEARGSPEGVQIIPNEKLKQLHNGARVAVAGLVTVRQRPGTAKGMVFMTLEDETGMANLVIRPNIWERDRRIARNKIALIAEGHVERQGAVIHVMVRRFHDLSARLAKLAHHSRDFH